MGYSFRLAARVLLYASSHRQDNTYHSLCYTSRGALAGTRNSSMGPPWRIDPTTHHTMSVRSYHGAISRSHINRNTNTETDTHRNTYRHILHSQIPSSTSHTTDTYMFCLCVLYLCFWVFSCVHIHVPVHMHVYLYTTVCSTTINSIKRTFTYGNQSNNP